MKNQFVALSLLTFASVPVLASDFYLLGEVGQSKFSIDSVSDTKNILAVGAGYKINETFALEVAYRDMGELKDSYQEDYGDGDYEQINAKVSVTALQASLIANFPVSESASVYGRIGIADLEAKVSFTDRGVWYGEPYSESESITLSENKAVYGAGFKYAFGSSFAARLEYSQYAEVEEIKVSSITLALLYQFR